MCVLKQAGVILVSLGKLLIQRFPASVLVAETSTVITASRSLRQWVYILLAYAEAVVGWAAVVMVSDSGGINRRQVRCASP